MMPLVKQPMMPMYEMPEMFPQHMGAFGQFEGYQALSHQLLADAVNRHIINFRHVVVGKGTCRCIK